MVNKIYKILFLFLNVAQLVKDGSPQSIGRTAKTETCMNEKRKKSTKDWSLES